MCIEKEKLAEGKHKGNDSSILSHFVCEFRHFSNLNDKINKLDPEL